MLENPFGENSCEIEKVVFQEHYEKYYFKNMAFSKKAVDRATYLIVGRRGVGKSSLIEYFSFHNPNKKSRSIEVNEPEVYQEVLEDVAKLLEKNFDFSTHKIKVLWEYVVWVLLFKEYKDKSTVIKAAYLLAFSEDHKTSASSIVLTIIRALISKFAGISKNDLEEIFGGVSKKVSSGTFKNAKEELYKHSRKEPCIIAIDSIEDYPVNNEAIMYTISALIEYASEFNVKYSHEGLHLKIFVTSEIFPHLALKFIANPSKHIREPLHLNWRPKELLKLICWRWQLYLKENGRLQKDHEVDWNDHTQVQEKLWYPYFGREIENIRGGSEPTFPYLLRHTQLRPRQLVIICNKLFNASKENSFLASKDSALIKACIKEAEQLLAVEVINSYKKIYFNIANILDALTGLPVMFKGKELDRVASRTKSQWKEMEYSPYSFKSMVAELGIIGRVRSFDERTGIISADFEFFQESRLSLTESDDCVFHPLFFEMFKVKKEPENYIVYPFPEGNDYELS
jgi:hypothetical protein